MQRWRGATMAAWLAAVCGCAEPDPFVCSTDDACVVGEVLGRCEPTGYCSFPDPSCDSGARYSELAADDLADTCVGTTDSGLELWTLAFDGDGAADMGHGIAVGPDAAFAVCGATGSQALVVSYRPDRSVAWTVPSAANGAAKAIAADGAGGFVVAGSRVGATDTGAWVRAHDPTGAETWSDVVDALGADEAVAVGIDAAGRVTAVGTVEQRVFVRQYEPDGQTRWTAELRADDAMTATGRAVAVTQSGMLWVAGEQALTDGGRRPLLRGLSPDGALQTPGDDPALAGSIFAIAVDPRGGLVVAGESGGQAWVQALDAELTPRWSFAPDDATESGIRTVAADSRDGFAIGGFRVASGRRQRWLARLANDGTVSWQLSDPSASEGEIAGIAVAPAGTILATGTVAGPGGTDVFVGGYTP